MQMIIRFALLSMLALVAFSGCNPSGPKLVDVRGTVTLDGKPVPNATIVFNPVAPGGSNSLGRTDSEGRYRLAFTQDKNGALVGEHIVEISTKKVAANEMPDDGTVVQNNFVEIPAKYRKRGELRCEVKNQSSDTINFDLKSN